MSSTVTPTAVCLIAVMTGGGVVMVAQPPVPAAGEPQRSAVPRPPDLPPGAVRLVSFTRKGDKVALCAEEPGGPLEYGARRIARTRVWIVDGTHVRQVGTAEGSCELAWSFDGQRIAVVSPDGLWVLTPDLRVTMHLVDTRHRDSPGDEGAHRTLSGPAWSPDGLFLAFVVSTGETAWVEAVHARTGATAHTSAPETYEFSWASDSRSLRFGSRVERLELP